MDLAGALAGSTGTARGAAALRAGRAPGGRRRDRRRRPAHQGRCRRPVAAAGRGIRNGRRHSRATGHVAALDRALRARGWRVYSTFVYGSPFGHAQTYLHDAWGYLDLHRWFPGIRAAPEAAFERMWADRPDGRLRRRRMPRSQHRGAGDPARAQRRTGGARRGRSGIQLDGRFRRTTAPRSRCSSTCSTRTSRSPRPPATSSVSAASATTGSGRSCRRAGRGRRSGGRACGARHLSAKRCASRRARRS